MCDQILVERRGPVLGVTFNRPEARNSMTLAMYERLYALCSEIDDDPAIVHEVHVAVQPGNAHRLPLENHHLDG